MSTLCRILDVSKSDYYDAKKRQKGKREESNQKLLREIVTVHEKYPAMGLDSIYHFLKPTFGASRTRIHRLMKKHNIHSVRLRAYKKTTNSNHDLPIAPNLLKNPDLKIENKNVVWVGDITYIPTQEGWLYHAIVKDLYTKKVVGYAFSERITADIVCSALNMAICRQKPGADLIFHSDRGSQYASNLFRRLLDENLIVQSMSRKGNPYDNAVSENFFSCLKCESLHLKTFKTKSEAKLAVFRYIEGYYNSVRPHSSINWLCPNDFEHSLKF